jgi:hypothetical protein
MLFLYTFKRNILYDIEKQDSNYLAFHHLVLDHNQYEWIMNSTDNTKLLNSVQDVLKILTFTWFILFII